MCFALPTTAGKPLLQGPSPVNLIPAGSSGPCLLPKTEKDCSEDRTLILGSDGVARPRESESEWETHSEHSEEMVAAGSS